MQVLQLESTVMQQAVMLNRGAQDLPGANLLGVPSLLGDPMLGMKRSPDFSEMPPAKRPGGAPVAGEDGNWQCPQCGNVNYAIRDACNRCKAPKPEGVEGVAGSMVRSTRIASSKAPIAGVDGNWQCPS